MDFLDFISEQPGLTPHAIGMYRLIDGHAGKIGAELAKHFNARDLRAKAQEQAKRGLTWLAARNSEQADALEQDPRLAAIPSLRAWAAGRDGIGNNWINFYVTLLKAHIEHLREQPQLEAAE